MLGHTIDVSDPNTTWILGILAVWFAVDMVSRIVKAIEESGQK
jgi:hypothetical protein